MPVRTTITRVRLGASERWLALIIDLALHCSSSWPTAIAMLSANSRSIGRRDVTTTIVAEFGRREHEESAANPATLGLRLLVERGDAAVRREREIAEASGRVHRRDGCDLAVRAQRSARVKARRPPTAVRFAQP